MREVVADAADTFDGERGIAVEFEAQSLCDVAESEHGDPFESGARAAAW